MLRVNTRIYAVPIIIVFIILLIYALKQRSSESLFSSHPQRVTLSPKLKGFAPRAVINSSDEHQFIVFKDESPLVRLYLDIVRDTVCGLTLQTQEQSVDGNTPEAKKGPFKLEQRIAGEDWPSIGITMIGLRRLINLEWALRRVIADGIPGDFIECGVWRGGASVFARAIFKALSITNRHVWVADSFQGLPKPRTSNDVDIWSVQHYLKVSLEEVQTNFRSFHLLDDHVHFCKGYFVDSLPQCNVSQLAVLRMDGDMYESTMDQLFNLYAKVPVGGIIIVDDYNIQECINAITDFRDWHNIKDEIKVIPGDRSGIYWIKKKSIKVNMDKYKPLLITQKPAQ